MKKDQIAQAIGAHGLWKARIQIAIETGKAEVDPAVASGDAACAFGQWLYALPPEERNHHFETVKKLHAEFHVEAGRLLRLALTGRKQEASAGLEPGSPFLTMSSKLTLAMMAWAKG